MNELMYQNYESFKAELDRELMQEAAGFVRIGYLLRVAQDTNILAESEYDNVNDFAKAEYGLDKSQVSRFIAINERFSEGGYSDRLEGQYQNFGVAKLGIMLQLPDYVNEQLTPDMTKSEINAVKEEVKEEEKISDIEVMLEEKSEKSLLWQILDSVMHEHPEIYKKVWEENDKAQRFNITTDSDDYSQDILAPAGEALYTTRVSGVGKVMLTVKTEAQKLIITNIRTGEVTEPMWEELGECLRFKCAMESAERAFKERYGEDFPIVEEPKTPKAPSKVTTTPSKPKKEVVKEPEKPINPQCEADSDNNTAAGEENTKVAPVQQSENVINPQCETDSEKEETETEIKDENEPEKVEGEVEEANKSENEQSEIAEKPINPQCEADSDTKEAAGEDTQLRGLKYSLKSELETAMEFCERNQWTAVITRLEVARNVAIECRKREDELEDELEDVE